MSVLDDSHSKPPTRIIASIDLTTKPNRKSSWLNDLYSTKFHDFSSSLSTSAQILANPTPTIQFTAVTIPDLSEAVRGEFSSLSDTTPSSLTATVQSDPIRIELPKEIESPSRHDHMEKSIAQTSRPFEPNNSTVISNTSDSSITIKLTTTCRPSGSPKPDLAQITIFQAEASKNVTDTIISQFQNDINQFQSTSHNTSGVSIFDSPTTISSLANQTDDPSKKLPSKIALNLANSSSSSSNKTTNRPLNNNSVNYSDVNISNSNNSSPTYTDNGKPNIRLSTKSPRSTTRVSSTTKVPQNSIKVKTLNSSKRPSTKADISLSNEWLSQIHHVTTQKPYVAKRDCGIRTMTRREGRVVGGRDSHLGEFPWSVLIRETTLLGFFVKTKCGGVLIDLKWVLTAAHCQPGMFGSLVVVVGEYDLQGKSSRLKPIIKKVKRMIIHRDYNPSNFDNDIALLELESPYQIQPHVVPICLPEKDEEFIGQLAMVAGWGKLSFGGPVPTILQVAKLPVIGNKQCQEMYHNSGHMKIISDSFLCAGYANGGQDSCEGDSGGPLQVQRNDSKWVLVGTVSHGIKCAEPNLPGIYIKTASYLPWIKAVTYHQDNNKRYGNRRGFSRLSEKEKQ